MRRTPSIGIVGAGPVGSLLALLLIDRGLSPTLIEARPDTRNGSRSIGIHPPSLEILDRLGLAKTFLAHGVKVTRGLAFGERGFLGEVRFERCPGPHRYVLTLPQNDTEALLRSALDQRVPHILERPSRLVSLRIESAGVDVELQHEIGTLSNARFDFLIACDGKHSTVRKALGIDNHLRSYDGRFAMADFPDETTFGSDAAVFLTREGLVESFPLPGARRRWVIWRGLSATHERSALAHEITQTIRLRTGHRLDPDLAEAPSVFSAEHALADALAIGPVALAGDAAHIVSPIGGQGMNLGWIGAASIADAIARAWRSNDSFVCALADDARKRRVAARAAIRRAEFDMLLGRPTDHGAFRDRSTRWMLREPWMSLCARLFTMRGLAMGI